jgi:hypothetical protein
MNPLELRESALVQRWLDKAGYRDAPTDEQDRVLEVLADFCRYTEATPETLVASCLRQTDAGTAISTKGRRKMGGTIEAFVAERGLSGRDAIVVGNRIRGFLVHNGVFMQGRAAIN